MMMKWVKNTGFVLFFLYLLVCVVLFFMQERLIFNPSKLEENFSFNIGKEVEIEVEDKVSLNCLWIKEAPSKGVVLYLHGNKGQIRRCIYQAKSFAGNGYDIFIPDYRGFGKSDGQIFSEEQLYGDVQKVYDYLKQYYPENKIVIAGYSLGTGMTSFLAAHNSPKSIALIAPYQSLTNLKNRLLPIIPDFLLKYHLDTEHFLDKIKCPITFFHGTKDRVIPFDSSLNLKKKKPDAELVVLEGESHRGSIFHPLLKRTMQRLLE